MSIVTIHNKAIKDGSLHLESQVLTEEPGWETPLAFLVDSILFLWKGRWLILLLCVCCATLGGVIWIVTPPKYTATAFVLPDLSADVKPEGSVGVPTVDLSGLIKSQKQLLDSYLISRQTVERLGLAEKPREVTFRQSLTEPLKNFLGIKSVSRLDATTREFRHYLNIGNDRGSHLITVSFTDRDPKYAAVAANALVSEFIVSRRLRRFNTLSARENQELEKLMADLGSKHPKVLRVQSRLETVNKATQRQNNSNTILTIEELAETGLVVPAEEITAPSSFSASLSVLIGAILGLGASISILLSRQIIRVLSNVMVEKRRFELLKSLKTTPSSRNKK